MQRTFSGGRSNAGVRLQVLPAQRVAAALHGLHHERGRYLSGDVQRSATDAAASKDQLLYWTWGEGLV